MIDAPDGRWSLSMILTAVRTVFRRAPAVELPTFGCKACPFTTADVWAAEQHTWGTGHLVDTISGAAR